MSTTELDDDLLFQNSVEFLHNVTSISCLTVPAIKSFYATKSRLIQLRNHIKLPKNITSTSVRCKKCLITFRDGPANYRVTGNNRSKFANRILQKHRKQKPLTKFQRKYFKRIKNKLDNAVVINCKFCKHETHVNMNKPDKLKIITIPDTPVLKKKKTKKKDKFCGLNKEFVSSVGKSKINDLCIVIPDSPVINKENNFEDDTPIAFKTIKIKQNKALNNAVVKNANSLKSIKKNKKSLNKLSQILNTPKSKNSPVSKLQSFLESL